MVFLRSGFQVQEVFAVLADDYYRGVIWFTVWQAAVSTIICLLIGLPLAYVTAQYDFRGKRLFRTLIMVPFVMPTVVMAVAMRALFARGGLFAGWLPLYETVWLIILANVLYNIGIVVRIAGESWERLSPQYREVAAVLGANHWQRFRFVHMPLMVPALAGAALLIFLYCFCSFGVILLLGGSSFSSIEVEIYRQTTQLLHMDIAAALAFIQLILTLFAGAVYLFLQRKFRWQLLERGQNYPRRRLSGSGQHRLVRLLLGIIVLVVFLPFFVLVFRSFYTENGFTLDRYAALFTNTTGSLFFLSPFVYFRNSFLIAGGAALLAVFLAMLVVIADISFRKRHKAVSWLAQSVQIIASLPLGVSAVVLGLGYLLSALIVPSPLFASRSLIIIMHAVIGFPFALATLYPAYQRIEPTVLEAAQVLGATSWQRMRYVVLPLIRQALAIAVSYVCLLSLGEFGAALMVSRPDNATLTVGISKYLSQPGSLNFGRALAMSSILAGVSFTGMLLIERLRQPKTYQIGSVQHAVHDS